jgi:hypothetical protein
MSLIYFNIKLRKLHLFLFFLSFYFVQGQKKNAHYEYHITKINEKITIDGLDKEVIWSKAEVAKDFYSIWPMDTSFAKLKTEVRMMYDDKNIYVYAINYIASRKYTVESLRRDWTFIKNDNFEFVMDTYNDITNGFIFGVNSAGAQLEAQQYDGAPTNPNWDNIWYSEVKQYDDKWTVEMSIPFKSIRFNKALKTWGINFSRNDLYSTEKSSWAPVPRQFPSVSSAFTGTLVWPDPPASGGANISMIPYVLSGSSKNFSPESPGKNKLDVGFDTKVALGSALNLDLTVNPDFSQVEVDRQQTNLDRFELFFPERRQFFLENDDLFNNLGMERIRPFFSRRIGLGVPIQFGGRISGKLNKNLRIGAMNIQTAQNEDQSVLGQNFSVLTLQQKVFNRSNITGFIINKEELNGSDKFHRNYGLEYNLLSKNNRWKGKLMYHQSANQLKLGKSAAVAGSIGYSDKNWSLSTQLEQVGENFTADVGFYQRNNYVRSTTNAGYIFLPKGTNMLTHGPGLFHFGTFLNNQYSAQEHTYGLFYNIDFRSRSNLRVFLARDYIELSQDFDPTNFTGLKIKAGTVHKWHAYGFWYNSKPQSPFIYNAELRLGKFYANGSRTRIATTLGYRLQPYAQLNLAAELNDIRFPTDAGLKNAKFYLIGPRIDLTLTNNLYFTTFIQYNEQIKNTNINARLQWRYKPVSDFYLVYTDNYDTNTGNVKNRAIVFKANYWWNI